MEPWGYSTHIDLYDCNDEKIKSKKDIFIYVDRLCSLINVKQYGQCLIEHFGDDEKVRGYTFVQMIETSLISGHLVEINNSAHIDVFSCKHFWHGDVYAFTVKHFEAKKAKISNLER